MAGSMFGQGASQWGGSDVQPGVAAVVEPGSKPRRDSALDKTVRILSSQSGANGMRNV